MKVSPIFLAIIATFLNGCTSLPGLLHLEEEPSSYGTFIAARYAAISRDTDVSAAFYSEVLDAEPGVTFVSQRAFQTELLAGDFNHADRSAQLAASNDDGNLARLYLKAASLNDLRGYRAPELDSSAGVFTRVMHDILDDWQAVKDGQDVEGRANLRLSVPQNAIPYLLIHKAMMFEAAGHDDQAEQTWLAARQTGEQTDMVIVEYGAFLERQRRRAEAADLYSDYLEMSDNRDPVLEQALQRTTSRGRAPRSLQAHQGAARSLYAFTNILIESAPPDYVALYLRIIQRLDPDYDRAVFLMAGSFEAIGMFDESLSTYDSIADGPYSASANVAAAWLQFRIGHTEAAMDRAIALREESLSAKPLFLIADMYRLTDQCADAIGLYNEALSRLADDELYWEPFYHRGICHQEMDDWNTAESDFLTALELSPDEPLILNHLGYYWIIRDENVERGFELVTRAAELSPQNGSILDSVGWGYFKQGQYDQAIRWLEDAVARSPADPTINWHLGDAYARHGQSLLARFQWRRALELSQDADETALIEERLSGGLENATPDLE